jgi:hypothetical protein
MRVGRIFGLAVAGFLLAAVFSGAYGASAWRGGILSVSADVVDEAGNVVNEIQADVVMTWIDLLPGKALVIFAAQVTDWDGTEVLTGYATVEDLNGDPNTKAIDLTLTGSVNEDVSITAFLAEIVDSLQNPTIGSLLSIVYDLVTTYVVNGCKLADVQFTMGALQGAFLTELLSVIIGDGGIDLSAFLAEIVD